jgi:hypothetical protein
MSRSAAVCASDAPGEWTPGMRVSSRSDTRSSGLSTFCAAGVGAGEGAGAGALLQARQGGVGNREGGQA